MVLRNTAVPSLLPFGSRGMFGPSARLFDKTGEGDPGGAGGDGGAGGAGDEKPLTAAEITELVGKTVNQALSAKLPKAITSAVTAALTPALEGIKADIAKAKGGAGNDDDDAGAGAGGQGSPGKPKKGDPETEALRAKVAQLEANQRAITEAAEAATKRARNDHAMSQLLAELSEITSSPVVAKTIAKNMLLVDNRIDFDAETGEPLFKHTRPAYAGGPPEDVLLSVKDGIAQWAKEEDAKPFLKAPTSGGGNGKSVGGSFGKSRVATGGGAPKLEDPGGLAAAEADIMASVSAKLGPQ